MIATSRRALGGLAALALCFTLAGCQPNNDAEPASTSHNTLPRLGDGGGSDTANAGPGTDVSQPDTDRDLNRDGNRAGDRANRRAAAAAGTQNYRLSAADGRDVVLSVNAPATVRAGQDAQYELTVTNNSDQPAHQVQVLNVSGAEATTLWDVGTLAAGESKSDSVAIELDGQQTVRNCLALSYNPAICIETNVVNPELQLVKRGPAEAIFCDPFEYVYTVTNTGTGVARNVVVSDELPEGLVRVGTTSRTVQGRVDELGPNQSRQLTVPVEALEPGTYASAATATSEGDEVSSEQLQTIIREATLEASIEGPEIEYVGQNVDYSVIVSNTGDAPSRATTMSITAAGADMEAVERPVPVIQPGEQVTVPVNLVSAARPGEMRLTATVAPFCSKVEASEAELVTALLPIQAIQIEVIDEQDPVRVGGQTVYIIEVLNEGTETIRDVALNAILPQTLSFVSGEGAGDVRGENRAVTFAPVAIASGETAQWRVTVSAVEAGQRSFRIEMNAPFLDDPVIEEEPTNVVDLNNPQRRGGAEVPDNK